MDHKGLAESILANVLSNHIRIIPIPEENWLQVREDYIQNKGANHTDSDSKEEQEEQEVEPHIEQAQQLFGEDVVEIQE